MSTAIGSVAQLVAVIRSQLAPRVEMSPSKVRTGARRTAAAEGDKARQLASMLAQRMRSIARDDPQRGKKAFRVFLESILLSHFGQQMINDPQFYQLVDRVQQTMEDDPQLTALVEKAIAHLTTAAVQQ